MVWTRSHHEHNSSAYVGLQDTMVSNNFRPFLWRRAVNIALNPVILINLTLFVLYFYSISNILVDWDKKNPGLTSTFRLSLWSYTYRRADSSVLIAGGGGGSNLLKYPLLPNAKHSSLWLRKDSLNLIPIHNSVYLRDFQNTVPITYFEQLVPSTF